jgi:hypothetical protein
MPKIPMQNPLTLLCLMTIPLGKFQEGEEGELKNIKGRVCNRSEEY